jgi:hypothetical protein
MIEIELIVGTMGLDKVLAGKLPRYSKSVLDRAGSTLKVFKTGAKTFAESNNPGNIPDWNLGVNDYDQITKDLQKDEDLLDLADSLETWPSELQTEVMVLLADIKVYLSNQLPMSQVTGALSSYSLPPSDSDKFRFLFQANLVDDIRTFVDLLNSGGITPIESALMRTLFPQTHDYLVIEVMDQVLDAVVDGDIAQWEGGWRKPALSGLLGVPVMDFQSVMQMQTGMEEKTAGRPKGPGSLQVAGFNQTDSQKLDATTIDQSK